MQARQASPCGSMLGAAGQEGTPAAAAPAPTGAMSLPSGSALKRVSFAAVPGSSPPSTLRRRSARGRARGSRARLVRADLCFCLAWASK